VVFYRAVCVAERVAEFAVGGLARLGWGSGSRAGVRGGGVGGRAWDFAHPLRGPPPPPEPAAPVTPEGPAPEGAEAMGVNATDGNGGEEEQAALRLSSSANPAWA
jgi:hypothetical protein